MMNDDDLMSLGTDTGKLNVFSPLSDISPVSFITANPSLPLSSSCLPSDADLVDIRRLMTHPLSPPSSLHRSRSLPDAVLVDVLRLLTRYQPGSDEERLSLMNRLDWLLASPRPHLIEVGR